MRLGFTIAFNALHHLQRNGYAEQLIDMLDYWVVVEGLALPGGSTAWCRQVGQNWHDGGASRDGTRDFLEALHKAHPKRMRAVLSDRPWASKDEMVNRALVESRSMFGARAQQAGGFLWQIDADEQWTAEDMESAEEALFEAEGDTGMFLADYYVGRDMSDPSVDPLPMLVARGEWGEGKKLPYRRLWWWKGQDFESHEPPTLKGGNGKEALLPQRFKHYAYMHAQDVVFKEDYYSGHEGLFERWTALQTETKEWPQPASKLISGHWGQTDTIITREDL